MTNWHSSVTVTLLFLLLVTAGCAGTSDVHRNLYVRQLFSEGLSYEALSEYSSALDRYTKIVQEYEGSSSWANRAHLRMARIYRNHLNRPEVAVEHYRSFLEQEEGGMVTGVRLELARVYRDRKQYEEAIEIYREIIQAGSSKQTVEEAYYYLGEVYLDSENYEESIRTFETFLDKFSSGDLADGALFNLADAHSQLGHFAEELAVYERLLKNYPNSGLREFAYFKAIRTAVKLDQEDTARTLAQAYLADYGKGQYWNSIRSLLLENFNVNVSQLGPEPLEPSNNGQSAS